MAFIYFTVGQKGSGKSLREARQALGIMNNYYRTERKYPELKKRIYFSKQKFAPRIEELELNSDSNPTGHLYYWSNAYQLLSCPRRNCWRGNSSHPVHNTDIFWDEIGDDISREKWNEIPEDLRQVFSHARKRGNRIFANTQKYEMVAIDFRRQVDVAVWVRKLFGSRDIDVTLPNIKRIWVIQYIRRFDPMDIENENDPRKLEDLVLWDWWWNRFAWYTGKHVSIFDTEWEVPPTLYNKLREVKYHCELGDNCTDPKHGHHIKHERY